MIMMGFVGLEYSQQPHSMEFIVIDVVVLIAPVHKVPSQLNIFIPVGIAMTEVPAMK